MIDSRAALLHTLRMPNSTPVMLRLNPAELKLLDDVLTHLRRATPGARLTRSDALRFALNELARSLKMKGAPR